MEAGAAVPEAGTAVDAASLAGPVRTLSTEKGLEKFQTSLVFHTPPKIFISYVKAAILLKRLTELGITSPLSTGLLRDLCRRAL